MDKMSGKEDKILNMEDWIKEEYLEEARLIEEEVLKKDDALSDDEIDVDASFERLMSKMKAQGIYPEDGPEAADSVLPKEAPTPELGRVEPHSRLKEPEVKNNNKIIEIPEPLPESGVEDDALYGRKAEKRLHGFMRGFAKAAIVVLVAGGCVFGLSMTSEANRNQIINSFNRLVGNDVQVNVLSAQDSDRSSIEESEAVRVIEDTMGVRVPVLMYRPEQFEFASYYLDKTSLVADIHYIYESRWSVNLNIMKYTKDTSSSMNFHGNLISTVSVMSNNEVKVDVYKIKEPSDKRASYVAKWNIEDVYYQLSGKLKEKEILQMLEQMEI